MTMTPTRRAHECERICTLIDIGEELDSLEEELDLAGRLMVTFIDFCDDEDLGAIGSDLAAALAAFPRDFRKIHKLLTHALTECVARGWLTDDIEGLPCHLHRLMVQAVSNGARLTEIADSYQAERHALPERFMQIPDRTW
jgi:hypothetical protein